LYDPNAPAEKLKLAEAEIERLRAASRTTEFDSPAG
jgi:hypothetical protein